MKARIVILLMIAVLLLAGCGKNKKQDVESMPADTVTTETTEESIPGVIDNIFDENGNVLPDVTLAPETEATTVPTEKPTTPTIPDKPSRPDSDGLKDPEAPKEPSGSATKPTEPAQPDEKEPTKPNVSTLTYEKFQAMTPQEQQAVMESFEDIGKFFDWYEKAQKEYEAAHPTAGVGDGNVDLDDYNKG